MDLHQNARLTFRSREALAKKIMLEKVTLNAAAAAFNVSRKTAAKWLGRYRTLGLPGLRDRSSRPLRSNGTGQIQLAKCAGCHVRSPYFVEEPEHGGWIDGFYAMDQWKVTSRLNVNFGLRYDITLLPIYGDNQNANNFVGDMNFRDGTYILSRNAPSCLQTNAAPCIPGGVLPAHVLVTPLGGTAIYHTDYNDIQPRIGVAYQLFPNTVLRAGYGRFFDNWAAITQTAQNYEGTWPSLDRYSLRRALFLDSVDGGTHNPTRTPRRQTANRPTPVHAWCSERNCTSAE
jgi:transposase